MSHALYTEAPVEAHAITKYDRVEGVTKLFILSP